MRGLLAVECLYNQIIAGRKTQTRRTSGLEVVNENPDDWNLAAAGLRLYPHNQISSVLFIKKNIPRGHMTDADSAILKPRYKIGEVLYLKEPTMQAFGVTKYRYSEYEAFDFFRNPDFPLQTVAKKWSNKLFMPASAARAFIRITGIRCERLMDISDQDCIAEGIEQFSDGSYKRYGMHKSDVGGQYDRFHMPRHSFFTLYCFANKISLNKPITEIKNPWCWVYEFTYLKDYKHA